MNLEKYLQVYPNDVNELKRYGRVLIELKQYGDIVEAYRKLLTLLEKNSTETKYILDNLGCALIMSGRPAEAIPYLEDSIKIDPKNEAAIVNLEAAKKDLELTALGEATDHDVSIMTDECQETRFKL